MKPKLLEGIEFFKNYPGNSDFMATSLLDLNAKLTESLDYADIIKFVIKNHPDRIGELVDSLWVEQSTKWIMHKLRKIWMGTTGMGGQHNNRRAYLVLAEAMKKHIYDSFEDYEEAYEVLLTGRDY